MANICDLTGFGSASNNNCLGKGGMKRFWVALCEEINWVTTGTAVAANADNILVAPPTMVGGAVFVEILFRKQNAQASFTRAGVLQEYEAAIVAFINGQDPATTKAIVDTLGCCCLAFFYLGQDNVLRFGGYDFDPGEQVFLEPTLGLMLGPHVDTTGEFGADLLNLSRNELTFTGTFARPPLHASFATSLIPV